MFLKEGLNRDQAELPFLEIRVALQYVVKSGLLHMGLICALKVMVKRLEIGDPQTS